MNDKIGDGKDYANCLVREACVETFQQCVKAEELGADRLELCADLLNGGTTPSFGMVKKVVDICKIPVFVIIRPRGGNFVYSEDEVEIMKEDIRVLKNLGVKGFVFGALTEDGDLDINSLNDLAGICRDKNLNQNHTLPELTFHMAFDLIPADGQLAAIDKLVSLKFKRILTKGSNTNANDGLENLKKFVEYSTERIIIMPGGGVTNNNYLDIANYTGCKEVHGRKIVGEL